MIMHTVIVFGVLCPGVTMLLTVSVLQLIVQEKLPTTSDAVPFIGRKYLINIIDENYKLNHFIYCCTS